MDRRNPIEGRAEMAWQKAGDFTVAPMLPANSALLRSLSIPRQLQGRLKVLVVEVLVLQDVFKTGRGFGIKVNTHIVGNERQRWD